MPQTAEISEFRSAAQMNVATTSHPSPPELTSAMLGKRAEWSLPLEGRWPGDFLRMMFVGGLTSAIILPGPSGTANVANQSVASAVSQTGSVGPIPLLSPSVAWDLGLSGEDLFPSVALPTRIVRARLVLSAPRHPSPISSDDVGIDW